jgi:hypothetical protein
VRRLFCALGLSALVLLILRSPVLAVDWKKVESKNLTVYSHRESLAKLALRMGEKEHERLVEFFRYEPSEKTKIYVYDDAIAFREVAPNRRVIGLARPFSSEIAVLASSGDLRSTISHELVHTIFLQSLPSLRGLPFWFVEGIAFYLSEPGLSGVDLERYALRGDISHIDELGEDLLPEEEGKAAAEGYLVTRFLVERYGLNKIRALALSMQKGLSFYEALEKNTGLTEQQLDEEWHKYGETQKRVSSLSELRYLGFLLIALLAVFASVYWLIKIRRRLSVEEEDMEEDL